MSFSFCCGSPSEEEIRMKQHQEESRRRTLSVCELRERYRTSRERRRRDPQVLMFRTVSEQPSDAISVVPVTQSLTSPWVPYSGPPPSVTFNQNQTTCDPWIIPLGLHRLSCPRRSLWSSEHRVGSSSDPLSSSSETPPCSSSDEDRVSRSTGDLNKMDSFQGSNSNAPEQKPHDGSTKNHPPRFFTETSITCLPSSSEPNLHVDPEETRSTGRLTCKRSSRLTRQLSFGGLGSSSARVHQNQDYTPFPSRRTRRVSETARRLGMYSSV